MLKGHLMYVYDIYSECIAYNRYRPITILFINSLKHIRVQYLTQILCFFRVCLFCVFVHDIMLINLSRLQSRRLIRSLYRLISNLCYSSFTISLVFN